MTYSISFKKPTLPRIRQGEIISQVPEIIFNSASARVERVDRQFCIVVTPDCDLERHWNDTNAGKRTSLRSVNFLMGVIASDRNVIPKDVWGRVKKSDHSSIQAIENCSIESDLKDQGLPHLAFDFRQLFSTPIEIIYEGIKQGTIFRRTQLLSPYREHFIQRFCSYFGRVALEQNHKLEIE